MPSRPALLMVLIALPGCVSPQVVVNATNEKAVAKRSEPAAKFGEYITAPGQVMALHGQELPAVDSPGTAFWPTSVKTEQPTETLIQPQAYSAKKSEPIKFTATTGEPPLMAAMRAYLDGRTDVAAERLNCFEPANQQLIMTTMTAMAHACRADLSGRNPADTAMLGSQYEAASDAAAKYAPLKVRKACFVWRVSQFGVYDPVPEKHPFLPGGSGVLYLELQNAPSQAAALPAGGPGFVTRLECSLQLTGSDGKPVGAVKTFPYAEYTRSPVRDYFLKIEFDVPSNPGPYTLVVDVRDPATSRKTRHAVDLTVGR
ncbi:hypothetical protein BH11PLA2_BH11PLA2_39230 [soil metagenome]